MNTFEKKNKTDILQFDLRLGHTSPTNSIKSSNLISVSLQDFLHLPLTSCFYWWSWTLFSIILEAAQQIRCDGDHLFSFLIYWCMPWNLGRRKTKTKQEVWQINRQQNQELENISDFCDWFHLMSQSSLLFYFPNILALYKIQGE